MIRKIKSFASGHGDVFLGVGKHLFTTSCGWAGSQIIFHYEVFSLSPCRAKANDPATAALTPDQVPLDHLPEPKPPTAGDSSQVSTRMIAHRTHPAWCCLPLCRAAGGGRESLHFWGTHTHKTWVIRHWQRSISLRACCLSETLTETKETPLGNLSPCSWKRVRVLLWGKVEGLNTFQASAEIQSAFCERKRKGHEAGKRGGGRAGEGCLNTKKLSLIKYLGRAHASEY